MVKISSLWCKTFSKAYTLRLQKQEQANISTRGHDGLPTYPVKVGIAYLETPCSYLACYGGFLQKSNTRNEGLEEDCPSNFDGNLFFQLYTG